MNSKLKNNKIKVFKKKFLKKLKNILIIQEMKLEKNKKINQKKVKKFTKLNLTKKPYIMLFGSNSIFRKFVE